MRLLITISFSFSIRYIVRTGLLEKLRSFCTPVIAIAWEETVLVKELSHNGYEVHVIPISKREPLYNDARKKINIWFKYFQLKSPSTKIQEKYVDGFANWKTKALRNLRIFYNICKLYIPGSIQRLFKKEKELLVTATNYNALSNFIDQLNIDAVFTLTPFHIQEDLLLRACQAKNKKMIAGILSFDNLTKRGWIPVIYDAYLLWNKYNERELYRIYPTSKQRSVYITGAPQFDFYFKTDNLLPEQIWRKKVGIQPEDKRKIILYAGGPKSLFPIEPLILRDIIDALNDGLISNAVVLFRCHPMDDIERWKTVIGPSHHIVYDKSWTGKDKAGFVNITDDDIKKLCSTLAYTDVHINLCSTMTVDGSAYSKPQIGPAYIPNDTNASAALRMMYYQEHFLPIIATGGLLLANSKKELIEHIISCLANPQTSSDKSNVILEEIITYKDGNNMERVVQALKQQLFEADFN